MSVTDIRAYHRLITNSYDKRSVNYWGNESHAYPLVERARPDPGDCVLDIGTGTGIVAFRAAPFVGPEGHVVGIDISKGMIAKARENREQRKAWNVHFHIADGEKLPFAKNTFDRIYCAAAFFWIVNKGEALKHWFDLLKPGGVVGFHAWPEYSYVHSQVAQQVLRRYGITYLAHTPTANKEICIELMRSAGYRQIDIQEKEEGSYCSLQAAKDSWIDEDHYPIGQYPHPVTGVAPEILAQARRDYDAEMERRNTDKGIWNNTSLYFIYGKKTTA